MFDYNFPCYPSHRLVAGKVGKPYHYGCKLQTNVPVLSELTVKERGSSPLGGKRQNVDILRHFEQLPRKILKTLPLVLEEYLHPSPILSPSKDWVQTILEADSSAIPRCTLPIKETVPSVLLGPAGKYVSAGGGKHLSHVGCRVGI